MKKQISGSNYRLTLRPSPIEGDGVFAAEEIPWGRKIVEYRGAVIDDKEAERRIAAGAKGIMKLGTDANIDGFDNGNGAAFINHRRENPNCFLLREKDPSPAEELIPIITSFRDAATIAAGDG